MEHWWPTDKILRYRLALTGPKRTADWLCAYINQTPELAHDKSLDDKRLKAFELYVQSKELWAAKRMLDVLMKAAQSKQEHLVIRQSIQMLEQEILASLNVDVQLLAALFEMGPLSFGGVSFLARRWAQEGRKHETACRLYTVYAGHLSDRLDDATISKKPLEVLRSMLKIEDAQSTYEIRRRIFFNARLQLRNPKLGWPLREMGLGWLKLGEEAKAERFLSELGMWH